MGLFLALHSVYVHKRATRSRQGAGARSGWGKPA